jgi:hypothetical protein
VIAALEIAAKLIGIGTCSGTRAALAMLVVATMARMGYVQLPESLSILASTPALGGLLAAAIMEEWLERDDDAQQILAMIKYGVHGAGAMVLGYGLVEQLHLPLQGWPIAAIGAALAVMTHNLRMRVHDALRGIAAGIVSPRRWLAWLEAGGVIGVSVAVLLAPAVAMVFVLLAGLCGVALWTVLRALERSRRRPCPTCGSAVRQEARVCPNCREALPVARWVGGSLLSRIEAPARLPR